MVLQLWRPRRATTRGGFRLPQLPVRNRELACGASAHGFLGHLGLQTLKGFTWPLFPFYIATLYRNPDEKTALFFLS